MALTYPLSLDVFWNWLPVRSAPFNLDPRQEISGQGSGRIIAAELASPLWRISVDVAELVLSEQAKAAALMEALDGAQKTFLATPKARPFPLEDRNGLILGAAAPVIDSVGADNKSLSIGGLPAGYQLRTGDFLSFVISGRHHLHRLVEDGAANGAGVTAPIELRPHLRPGAAAGAAVTLVNPVAEMLVTPGSYEPGATRGAVLAGMTFNAVQRL